ncbi:hypothetical protein PV10_06010 [Exophiala mesophila]|uniref:Amidase domain-containing protein n=1 Tax=Exophiala mesophila TaxID=212818 RepID=A0A0D1ZC24_EXOME|nr:uncharacterized protein PV10_06010 [Exophiala mesophila]KIV91474.1 hypothetical protein PV10_06010 [Exophiala mesophila]
MRTFEISVAACALLGLAIAHDDPFALPLCNGVDIKDATIDSLQTWMTEGRLTSQDLVTCYLARIEQTNGYLASISEVNPDALEIAAALDEERATKGIRGPMHGIPFVVKDNMYTDDKHNTSEGTLVLLGGRYVAEATVVTKVRNAGGVLLGHSTMSEAADHRALSQYASGYSSRTGQGRNPYNLTQSTAGSSSGSVIAIRSNQVPVALGTETHGSLVHPSCQLGLYTIKSTPGLMSRFGIVTGSYYHDTAGPLARSIKDAAILLDIMKGIDSRDNLTFEAAGKYPTDGYTSHVVGKDALRGMKLGVPWEAYWASNGHVNSPGNREQFEETFATLEAAGAELYNITDVNPFAKVTNSFGGGMPASTPPELNHLIAFSTLMSVGYAEWLRNWTFPEGDERYGMSTIEEMVEWNKANNDTTGALGNGTWWWNNVTGQSFYDNAVATNGSMGSEFWTAFGWGRSMARQAIDNAHAYQLENGTVIALDGVLIPNGRDGNQGNACASVPAYAGYPVAQVPIGMDGYSVPFGLCVYGHQYGEAKLVTVASAMEDLFQWNEEPMWYNYDTAEGPWDAFWPGYTCSQASLGEFGCEPA